MGLNTEKVYLGDAVYATFDGIGIVLTTENGIHITNTIYLDFSVIANLQLYIKELSNEVKKLNRMV